MGKNYEVETANIQPFFTTPQMSKAVHGNCQLQENPIIYKNGPIRKMSMNERCRIYINN